MPAHRQKLSCIECHSEKSGFGMRRSLVSGREQFCD
jgi:hypothetical protein